MQRHNWFPNSTYGDPKPTRSADCTVHKWGSPNNPGITFRGPLMEVQNSKSATLVYSKSWASIERIRIVFTVPSDGVVRLIFRGKTGKDTEFYQIICTEAGSDESFFTGGTMPLQNN